MQNKVFFDHVRRLFGGTLRPAQVSGMEAIVTRAHGEGSPLTHLAYMLATTFHETAATMQPIIETRQPREKQNPSVETAIRRLDKAFHDGKLTWVKTPYWRKDDDGKSWLGRGLVQLTHKRNYKVLSSFVGIDLVADPEQALVMSVALSIMFEGMEYGLFTGHKLSDHLRDGHTDYVNARRIINGRESAEKVAGYAMQFEAALMAAGYAATPAAVPAPKPDAAVAHDEPAPRPVPPTIAPEKLDPEKLDKPIGKSKTVWMWLTTALGAPFAAFGGLDWRVQLAIVVVIVGFAIYAIKRRRDIAKVYRELKEDAGA